MSVEVLPSARERSAEANLVEFIRYAREDIAAFGADLDFDASVWNVASTSNHRPSAGHQASNIAFLCHQVVTGKGVDGRTPLSEPFASFIKAVIRRRQEARAVSHVLHGVTVRAGRYLHDILAIRGHDPSKFVPEDFMVAASVCQAREEASSAYRVGLQLAEICSWVNRYNIARVHIDFKNPIPRPGNEGTRIGKEADDRRADKLPSSAALDALAAIANLATEPADILRIRVIELLVCGGWRINELLTLPALCEIEEPAMLNGAPVLGPDGQHMLRYGIAYHGEKGAGHRTKWIPTAMIDVAKRAILDITRLTQPSRSNLAWMAQHPGRVKLPDPWCDLDPHTELSSADVAQMLGLSRGGSQAGTSFLKSMGVSVQANGQRRTTIGELEAYLLARQPIGPLPTSPIKAHEYLFVMPMNWCHRGRADIHSIVEVVSDQQISNFITGREGIETIFTRFGFAEDDGSPIELTSHQFRHWLNTLQQMGGMSQMEIARWSGRKDVGQNAAYDHMTGVQLAEKSRKLLESGRVHGPVATIREALPPVRRKDFTEAQFTTAHTTDIGMCGNDWSLAPCPSHGSCAGCEQHFINKGDQEQRARTETMLLEHEFLLAQAEVEAEEETYGASNFVEHHRAKCQSLRKILAVHADTSVPDGDLVHVELKQLVSGAIPLVKRGNRLGTP